MKSARHTIWVEAYLIEAARITPRIRSNIYEAKQASDYADAALVEFDKRFPEARYADTIINIPDAK